VPIGIAQGALSAADGSVISYALMLSVVLSTYAIPANYRIAAALGRLAGRSGAAAGAPQAAGETGPGHAGPGDAAHGGSAPEIT
jgi:hypothetical protein